MPVLGAAEPHLGLHALGVPIAPLGHCDGRRTIDEQARLGADLSQVGIVILGDDVEIGANTTLDRARFSCTRVGTGTKKIG